VIGSTANCAAPPERRLPCGRCDFASDGDACSQRVPRRRDCARRQRRRRILDSCRTVAVTPLTSLAHGAGCGCKLGPADVLPIVRDLPPADDPTLLVGTSTADDAAVYRLADDLALVQTVDFFPPIVDDPYTFGAIAAANALSDIYAMGGRPILALAIAGFPEDLPPAVISAILQGGADKVAEAGAVVAGGHTVVDKEPKYGLCVTGLIHPDRVTAKGGARPGDVLLLSKPLGTGVITTAHKRGIVTEHLQAAIASMLRLNRRTAEIAADAGLHGATDITGYGLLGHASELARNSGAGMEIDLEHVPLLPGALDYARRQIFPGGLGRNRDYLLGDGFVRLAEGLDPARAQLLFDPQTSGGLLFALPAAAGMALRARMDAAGEPCWEIGRVVEGAGINVKE
jgi:selenide, water dikinase